MANIFISHSSKDKAFARRLSEDLKDIGHEPWLDEWEIKVGECIVTKIDRGIEDSEFVAIILSKHSVESGWVDKEWKTKYWSEIQSDRTMVLPLLKDNCTIPTLLKTKRYADFREKYVVAFTHLVEAINYKTANIPERPTISSEEYIVHDSYNLYWHRGVQEYFGQTLHLVFVRYNSESILFKKSVLSNLENSRIINYMIFELLSKWDILIRYWSTENQASVLISELEKNIEIEKVVPLSVIKMEHIYDDGYDYPTSEEIKDLLDNMPLEHLLDLQQNKENSKYYDMAKSEGLLLSDRISFDPGKVQFYVVISSLKQPGEAILYNLIEHINNIHNITGKTIYITRGTSIRIIIKGQASEFYDISAFLSDITKTLKSDDFQIMTETILVANRSIQICNLIDFGKVQETLVDNNFESIISELKKPVDLDLGTAYEIKAKLFNIVNIIHMDDQEVLINLVKGRLSGDATYLISIKDFFPHFEQEMRDALPHVVRKEYGNNWREVLDEIKGREGITKNTKANKLVIGDLCKIYKSIFLEKKFIDIAPMSDNQFRKVFEDLPGFRNILAHRAASLDGWEALFDFCTRFIPVRSTFISYFDGIK